MKPNPACFYWGWEILKIDGLLYDTGCFIKGSLPLSLVSLEVYSFLIPKENWVPKGDCLFYKTPYFIERSLPLLFASLEVIILLGRFSWAVKVVFGIEKLPNAPPLDWSEGGKFENMFGEEIIGFSVFFSSCFERIGSLSCFF